MSIKNPVRTSDLSDFGEIASPATPTSQTVSDNSTSKSQKPNPSPGSFEQQLEDEINKRAKKEGLL